MHSKSAVILNYRNLSHSHNEKPVRLEKVDRAIKLSCVFNCIPTACKTTERISEPSYEVGGQNLKFRRVN